MFLLFNLFTLGYIYGISDKDGICLRLTKQLTTNIYSHFAHTESGLRHFTIPSRS